MNSQKLSRKRVTSYTLLNLAATPGLGSLMARRWVAGSGQLGLSIAGFCLVMVWFYQLVVIQFYGQIDGAVEAKPVGWIGLLGAGLFGVAWFWSFVTSMSFSREAADSRASELRNSRPSLAKPDKITTLTALTTLPGWTSHDEIISRTFTFKDFSAALKFVNAVADIAERANHHPDVDIRWNKVTLALTTHDVGGLTEKDFALARECNEEGRMKKAE